MAYTLSNKCAKNLCKRTLPLQLIIKNVVTCFFGTQCRHSDDAHVGVWVFLSLHQIYSHPTSHKQWFQLPTVQRRWAIRTRRTTRKHSTNNESEGYTEVTEPCTLCLWSPYHTITQKCDQSCKGDTSSQWDPSPNSYPFTPTLNFFFLYL